jgi:hypothetical protein
LLPHGEVANQLPVLARHQATLYLKVEPADLNAGLVDLIDSAGRHGVAVRYWLQLPDNGIWLNENNVAGFQSFALEFLGWTTANHVAADWLIFDLEPAREDADTLFAAAMSGDLAALVDLLGDRRDPARFEAARQSLSELVDALHARGVRVMAVTLPWIIDDRNDGDTDIQDVFNVPFEGVHWDEVSVMTYRPTFGDIFGIDLPPGYVARYATTVRERFGDRAEVAIGNIGSAGRFVSPGYHDPGQLTPDVSAALSVGVRRISVFGLDGMVEHGDVDAWLSAARAPSIQRPHYDVPSVAIRAGINLLDGVANQPE